MSDFSPEFRAALSKEIDRMGTTLAAACALRDQIDGEDDGGGDELSNPFGDILNVTTHRYIKSAADRAHKPRKAKAIKRDRARAAISPEQLASRQIQGRYLGLIRQFPKRARREFQTIARKQSREKAIIAMERGLRGKRASSKAKAKPAKAQRRSKPSPAATNDSPAQAEV